MLTRFLTLSKSCSRAGLCFCGFGFAVAGCGGCNECVEHFLSGGGYAFDGEFESLFIRLRRLVHPRQLSHELQRRGINLGGRRRRIKIVERLDIPAHKPDLSLLSRVPLALDRTVGDLVDHGPEELNGFAVRGAADLFLIDNEFAVNDAADDLDL